MFTKSLHAPADLRGMSSTPDHPTISARAPHALTRSRCFTASALAAVLILAGAASPLVAQTTVVHGRVDDAISRTPLAAVTVFSTDSVHAAVTDSTGRFVLRVPAGEPVEVLVERVGYQTMWFRLPRGAEERRSVLLLEPAPIELQGIDVVGESAVSEALEGLERRRNAFPGAVSAFDRARLERLAPVGSVWDFLRREAPYAYPCSSSMSGLCSRESRGRRSVLFAPSQDHVTLCLDGRDSWIDEVAGMDIEAVALIEVYRHGRGGIRVYTPGYITSRARRGRTIATPLEFGC